MHHVDISFREDGCRSSDNWWNKDLTGLSQLANMTCFSIPMNIAGHRRPPKPLVDVCFCGEICFVTKGIMGDVDNVESMVRRDDEFVCSLRVFAP
jgi:hypothetical protein